MDRGNRLLNFIFRKMKTISVILIVVFLRKAKKFRDEMRYMYKDILKKQNQKNK